MREKDRDVTTSSGRGSRSMSSSQVKQTLAKLEKNGESSRIAMTSLKECVENMDEATIPRFVAQVSDAKEKGCSRAYAISLYEDVARVHGKVIIPQLHRVMGTVVRCLSSSGSSPQLQEACAKVLTTIAKHAIDESSPATASEVLRDLCNPLVDVLDGKPEPLAAGAAVCLQALVECENWKFASDEVVADICYKTTAALSEKGTRTVAHMHLARALAISNSSRFGSYGVAILRIASEVLKSSAVSGFWQQRAGAARLVTAVLPTVDRAAMGEELAQVVRALDGCKHDRMSNVRWSVKEALKTSKSILAQENSRRLADGEEPLSWTTAFDSTTSSLDLRRSGSSVSSNETMSSVSTEVSRPSRGMSLPPAVPFSPTSSFRGLSPASSVIAMSPSLPPNSTGSRAKPPAVLPPTGLQQRSPLQATKLHIQVGSFDVSSVTSSNDIDSPKKENWSSKQRDTKAGSLPDAEQSPGNISSSGPVGTYVRPRPPTPGGTFIPYPPPSPRAVHQYADPENNLVASSKGLQGRALFPVESVLVRADRGTAKQDAFPVANEVSIQGESRHDISGPTSASGEGEQFEMMISNGSGIDYLPSGGVSRRQGVLDGSTMKHVFELKGPVSGNSLRNVRTYRDGVDDVLDIFSSSASNDDWKEPSHRVLSSPLKVESPAPQLRTFEDSYRLQKSTSVIGADEYFPFTTPRRLVRSLQGSFSGSIDFPSSRLIDTDSFKFRGDESRGETTITDMDLGTPTSSTGWSVRTNPIASDESLKTDSDDSDHEGRPIWKKMVSDSSPSPTTPAAPHTPPGQECVDNPDHDDGFRHRLNHPGDPAVKEPAAVDDAPPIQDNNAVSVEANTTCDGEQSPQEERERHQQPPLDLFDGAEIVKRTQHEADLETIFFGQEVSYKECIDKWSCTEILSRNCDAGEGSSSPSIPEVSELRESHTCSTSTADMGRSRNGREAAKCGKAPPRGGKKSQRVQKTKNLGDNVKDFFGWSWNRGKEQVLRNWQVCMVAVAIPFAVIALSTVFLPPATHDPRYLRKRSNVRNVSRNLFEF